MTKINKPPGVAGRGERVTVMYNELTENIARFAAMPPRDPSIRWAHDRISELSKEIRALSNKVAAIEKVIKPPGVADRAGEGSVEHMDEREVLILTRDQKIRLRMFLELSTGYRQEQEAICKRVAERTKEGDKPDFPYENSNGKWWKETNGTMEEIIRDLYA